MLPLRNCVAISQTHLRIAKLGGWDACVVSVKSFLKEITRSYPVHMASLGRKRLKTNVGQGNWEEEQVVWKYWHKKICLWKIIWPTQRHREGLGLRWPSWVLRECRNLMEGYHSGCGSQLCRLGKKSAQTLDHESEYIWKDLFREPIEQEKVRRGRETVWSLEKWSVSLLPPLILGQDNSQAKTGVKTQCIIKERRYTRLYDLGAICRLTT